MGTSIRTPFKPEASKSTLDGVKESKPQESVSRMLVPEHVSFHFFYVVMLPLRFCLGEKYCG